MIFGIARPTQRSKNPVPGMPPKNGPVNIFHLCAKYAAQMESSSLSSSEVAGVDGIDKRSSIESQPHQE
jgi:hypothetical protein